MALLRSLLRDQRVAFLLVGAVNTAVGLGCFAILHLLLREHLHYLVTLALAYAVSILCAFGLHRRFVFRVRGQIWLDLARFWMVNLSTLALNAALLALAVERLGLPVLPAQVVVLGITVVVSFAGHRWLSFRR